MTYWYFSLKDIFDGTYTLQIISSFAELLWLVGPYFIISILINVLISRYLAKRKIDFSSGYQFIDILIAAFIGLVLPLPTYIAVPIGVSLLITGIPFTAVVAFMLASPLMNLAIFYFSWSQLGFEIAFVRVFASFIISVSGGYLGGIIFKKFQPKLIEIQTKVPYVTRTFWLDCWRNVRFLGRYFIIALLLSAAVKALVPAEMIARLLGGNANMSLVAAISLGVPFYSCGGAAIPLVEVLSEMGMNKGAGAASQDAVAGALFGLEHRPHLGRLNARVLLKRGIWEIA